MVPRLKPRLSVGSLLIDNRALRAQLRREDIPSTAKDEAERDFVNKRIAEINARIRASNSPRKVAP